MVQVAGEDVVRSSWIDCLVSRTSALVHDKAATARRRIAIDCKLNSPCRCARHVHSRQEGAFESASRRKAARGGRFGGAGAALKGGCACPRRDCDDFTLVAQVAI